MNKKRKKTTFKQKMTAKIIMSVALGVVAASIIKQIQKKKEASKK
jgi:hypothetical protein